jgi:hypothetical protein
MPLKDIFGLIVRVGGLTCVVFAFFDLLHVIADITGLPLAHHYPAAADVVAAAFYLIPGLVLLMAAKPITRLAYWRD